MKDMINAKAKKPKIKVAAAISGGVDSAVAAYLLRQSGDYEVFGVYMRLFPGAAEQKAQAEARRICRHLGIKFYALNLAAAFKREVKDYFLSAYQKGLTPNPCVRCNQKIKFGLFLQRAAELGADLAATGHYVSSQRKNGKWKLYQGQDQNKDQSYFLYHLTQAQLSKVLFPLGRLDKDQVRELARKNNLPHSQTESADICFLSGDHNEYLEKKLKQNPGDILTLDGKKVGRHRGLYFYTLGQRKGIEIGGAGPFYTVGFDWSKNLLYVSNQADDPVLAAKRVVLTEVNWIGGQAPSLPLACQAMIRYRQKPAACQLEFDEKEGWQLKFAEAPRAATPGQSAVILRGREIIGGGIIKKSLI